MLPHIVVGLKMCNDYFMVLWQAVILPINKATVWLAMLNDHLVVNVKFNTNRLPRHVYMILTFSLNL